MTKGEEDPVRLDRPPTVHPAMKQILLVMMRALARALQRPIPDPVPVRVHTTR